MCDVPIVDELECLQDLAEETLKRRRKNWQNPSWIKNDIIVLFHLYVLLEGDHVLVQHWLEVSAGGTEKRTRIKERYKKKVS